MTSLCIRVLCTVISIEFLKRMCVVLPDHYGDWKHNLYIEAVLQVDTRTLRKRHLWDLSSICIRH